MKTPNILKSVVTLAFIFLCFGCSTEAINQDNSETTNLRPGLIDDPCSEKATTIIYAVYDFTGLNVLQQLALKNNFEDAMSQHFTICNVGPTNCDDVEVWTVNTMQYEAYLYEHTTGGGSTSSGHENNGELKDPDDYISSCI